MRRVLVLMIIAALSIAACSSTGAEPSTTVAGSDDATTTAGDDSPQTTQAGDVTTTGDEGPTTTSAPQETETTSGRPVAPDFTLQLGDGGSYTLSEGSKPVYMIFWAEW